jgi:hypothetical protein
MILIWNLLGFVYAVIKKYGFGPSIYLNDHN